MRSNDKLRFFTMYLAITISLILKQHVLSLFFYPISHNIKDRILIEHPDFIYYFSYTILIIFNSFYYFKYSLIKLFLISILIN